MSKFDEILDNFESLAQQGESDVWSTKQELKDTVMNIVRESLDTDDPYAYIEREIGGL
jgi:hypothetical protein